jgi:hypothetical protein
MIPKSIAKPNITGKTTEQAIQALYEYSIQLEKKLDYALKNVGTENMTTEVADVIIQAVRNNAGLNTTVSNETFVSAIKQLADNIKLMVTKDGVVTAINLTDGEVRIDGSKLTLTGAISANDNVTIDENGLLTCLGATIGGILSSVSGTFVQLYATFASGQRIEMGQRTIGAETFAGLFFSTANDSYFATDSYAVFRLKNTGGGFNVVTGTPFSIEDNLYVGNNVSAASFTDRTPSFDGDALEALSTVKNDNNKNIDHTTLPVEAQKKITKRVRVGKGKRTKVVVEEGRDLGMMISILTKGIQQLTEITTQQQKKIIELENGLNMKGGGEHDR